MIWIILWFVAGLIAARIVLSMAKSDGCKSITLSGFLGLLGVTVFGGLSLVVAPIIYFIAVGLPQPLKKLFNTKLVNLDRQPREKGSRYLALRKFLVALAGQNGRR